MRSIPLGQLFELKYGKSLPKGTRAQGRVPVYGSNGAVGFHNENLVNKPTIVVGRKGSIGEVHLVSTPCWPIDTTYFVKSLGNYDYDLEWLYRLLKTLRLQELNRSAAIPGLNRDDVYRIEVNLPPLDEQKRIAHLLGKVEGLIARRKQHLQQLDGLLKSVFLEMFGDPLRNEKGWDKPELKQFGKISTGNTPPRKDPSNYGSQHIEWVKTDNISADSIFISQAVEYLSKAGATRARTVTNGALMVACIAGSVESIGRSALTNRTVAFNQQINAIQPNKEVDPFYLYVLFKISKAYIQSHASKGMKKILTKGDFEKITMIKPPVDLQKQFATVAEKIDSLKVSYQQNLANLEMLYGALSQKAFKGELDLSRVVVALEQEESTEEIQTEIATVTEIPVKPAIELPTPAVIADLTDADRRMQVIGMWLDSYLEQLRDLRFSAQDFMEAAQQKLWELLEDDTYQLTVAEYDHVKDLIFNAIETGRLTQSYIDHKNLVQITAARG